MRTALPFSLQPSRGVRGRGARPVVAAGTFAWPDLPAGTWERHARNDFSGATGVEGAEPITWDKSDFYTRSGAGTHGYEAQVTDPSSPPPDGGSSFGRFWFGAGWEKDGEACARRASPELSNNIAAREVVVRLVVRMSSDWVGHSSGVNKLGFVGFYSPFCAALILNFLCNGDGTVRPELRTQTAVGEAGHFVNLTSNVPPYESGAYTVDRNEWTAWDLHLISNSEPQAEDGYARLKLWKESDPVFRTIIDTDLAPHSGAFELMSEPDSDHLIDYTNMYPIYGGRISSHGPLPADQHIDVSLQEAHRRTDFPGA